MIEEQFERRVSRKADVGIVHRDGYRMWLAIVEKACKRRQIHAVWYEFKRFYAGYGPPKERIDAARVDPWIDRSDSCDLTVDRYLTFAERRISAAFQLGG